MSCGNCNCDARPGTPTEAPSATLGTVAVRVFRYRPGGKVQGWFETYDVPYSTETSVIDALNWIKAECDPTLGFRVSCRMGICGSCGLMIDGRPRLACETFVRELTPGFKVEPLANFAVERDLIVDKQPFLDALKEVQAWVEPGDDAPVLGTATQTPKQRLKYADFAQCINCLLCYAACPQVGLRPFLGPAAITAAMRYNQDNRDAGGAARLPVLDREEGIWPCTFVGVCSQVCPKGVDPAAAVQLAKVVAARAWVTGGEER